MSESEKRIRELWRELYTTPLEGWQRVDYPGMGRGWDYVSTPRFKEIVTEAGVLLSRLGILPHSLGWHLMTWTIVEGYRPGDEIPKSTSRVGTMQKRCLLSYKDLIYTTVESRGRFLHGEPVVVKFKIREKYPIRVITPPCWFIPQLLGFVTLPGKPHIVKRAWIPGATTIDKNIWQKLTK